MEILILSLIGALVILISVSVYHIRKERRIELERNRYGSKVCYYCKRKLPANHFKDSGIICDSCRL